MAEPLGRGLHFVREAGVQTASAFIGQGQARALTIYVLDEAVSFDALEARPIAVTASRNRVAGEVPVNFPSISLCLSGLCALATLSDP